MHIYIYISAGVYELYTQICPKNNPGHNCSPTASFWDDSLSGGSGASFPGLFASSSRRQAWQRAFVKSERMV